MDLQIDGHPHIALHIEMVPVLDEVALDRWKRIGLQRKLQGALKLRMALHATIRLTAHHIGSRCIAVLALHVQSLHQLDLERHDILLGPVVHFDPDGNLLVGRENVLVELYARPHPS